MLASSDGGGVDERYFDELYKLRKEVAKRISSAQQRVAPATIAPATTNASPKLAQQTGASEDGTGASKGAINAVSTPLIQVADRKFQGDLGNLDQLVRAVFHGGGTGEATFDEIWLHAVLLKEVRDAAKRSYPSASSGPGMMGIRKSPSFEELVGTAGPLQRISPMAAERELQNIHQRSKEELMGEILQKLLDNLKTGGTLRIVDASHVLTSVEKCLTSISSQRGSSSVSFARSISHRTKVEKVSLDYTTFNLLVIEKIAA